MRTSQSFYARGSSSSILSTSCGGQSLSIFKEVRVYYLLLLKAAVTVGAIYGILELLNLALEHHFDYGKGSKKKRLF